MSNRVAMSKSQRFDIFNRDGFCCQYCGKSPPVVKLEVDHIIPVAKGGSNDPSNLATSCNECNNGKRAKSIGDSAAGISTLKRAQEAMESIEMSKIFSKSIKAREKIRNEAVSLICSLTLCDTCLKTSVTGFVHAVYELGSDEAIKMLEKSAMRTGSSSYNGVPKEKDMMMYFYGIMRSCRNGGSQCTK